jgi:translation initiation factor 2 subunit 1
MAEQPRKSVTFAPQQSVIPIGPRSDASDTAPVLFPSPAADAEAAPPSAAAGLLTQLGRLGKETRLGAHGARGDAKSRGAAPDLGLWATSDLALGATPDLGLPSSSTSAAGEATEPTLIAPTVAATPPAGAETKGPNRPASTTVPASGPAEPPGQIMTRDQPAPPFVGRAAAAGVSVAQAKAQGSGGAPGGAAPAKAADSKAAQIMSPGHAAHARDGGGEQGRGEVHEMEERAMWRTRMYRAEYPAQNEIVRVRVAKVDETAVYVLLLEYGQKHGMILLSDMSRKRIRSAMHVHARVGQEQVAQVLRVDDKKGYIDLTKRSVTPADAAECAARFERSKTVHSLLFDLANKTGGTLLGLYEQFGWDLHERFGHAYDGLKLALRRPELALGRYQLDEGLRALLRAKLEHRFGTKSITLRADVELTCFSPNGIDGIRAAIRAALAQASPDATLTCKVITAPKYALVCVCADRQDGAQTLQRACDAMAAEIKKQGGDVTLKTPLVSLASHGAPADSGLEGELDAAAMQARELDAAALADLKTGPSLALSEEEAGLTPLERAFGVRPPS